MIIDNHVTHHYECFLKSIPTKEISSLFFSLARRFLRTKMKVTLSGHFSLLLCCFEISAIRHARVRDNIMESCTQEIEPAQERAVSQPRREEPSDHSDIGQRNYTVCSLLFSGPVFGLVLSHCAFVTPFWNGKAYTIICWKFIISILIFIRSYS